MNFKKNRRARKGGTSYSRTQRRKKRFKSSSSSGEGISKEKQMKILNDYIDITEGTGVETQIYNTIIDTLEAGRKIVISDKMVDVVAKIVGVFNIFLKHIAPKHMSAEELVQQKISFESIIGWFDKSDYLYFSNDNKKAFDMLIDGLTDEQKLDYKYYFKTTAHGQKHLAEIKKKAEINIEQANKEAMEARTVADGAKPKDHDCEPKTLKMPLACKLQKCPKWKAKVNACDNWKAKESEALQKEKEKMAIALLDRLNELGLLEEEAKLGGKRRKRTRRKRKKTKRKRKRKRTKKKRKRQR